MDTFGYWLVIVILILGIAITVKANKLTIPAALTGGLLGLAIFVGSAIAE